MSKLKDRLSEYDWELLKQQLHDVDSAMTIINRILDGQPRSTYGNLHSTAPIHCMMIGKRIDEIRRHVLAEDLISGEQG